MQIVLYNKYKKMKKWDDNNNISSNKIKMIKTFNNIKMQRWLG